MGTSQDVAVASLIASYKYTGSAGAALGEEVDEFTGSIGVQVLFEKYDIFRTIWDCGSFLHNESLLELEDLSDEAVVFFLETFYGLGGIFLLSGEQDGDCLYLRFLFPVVG